MKDYFGKDLSSVTKKKFFLLDMDGTIYNDKSLLSGAEDFLKGIKRTGGRYVFITNNSSRSVKDYVLKLKGLGILSGEEEFFTSAQASARLLREKFSDGLIYAQGTRSFIEELKGFGLKVTESYDRSVAAVIVGFDTELNFEKLTTTCRILTELDVPYFATNPDWVCPVAFGFVPDCGSMCFSIEKATGKTPTFIGKPSPVMILSAMEKFSVTAKDTVVIGDRLYTDVASGVNAGVDTICVLSGEATLEDVEKSTHKPTYVIDSIKDIIF